MSELEPGIGKEYANRLASLLEAYSRVLAPNAQVDLQKARSFISFLHTECARDIAERRDELIEGLRQLKKKGLTPRKIRTILSAHEKIHGNPPDLKDKGACMKLFFRLQSDYQFLEGPRLNLAPLMGILHPGAKPVRGNKAVRKFLRRKGITGPKS
jgi:hypothetical protein